MSGKVDLKAIPRDVKARVCSAAANAATSPYPHQVLPGIALHHGLTIDQVKAIVQAHGWPRPNSLRRAASILARGGDPLELTTPSAETVGGATSDGQTLVLVDVDKLYPDPQNIRDDLGNLDELARSIRDVGILQPIVARRHAGDLVIVMGHRRHAAAKLAGLRQVPVIVRAGAMDPDDVLAAMLVENGQRLDLDPIEEARALARLKRADKASDLELAERISKSQPYVSGRLALLSLTPQQQAAVRAGTLTITRAVKLGRDQGGTNRPGAQGKASAAHLAWSHPLAEKASILCAHNGHNKNHAGRPGGVACGQCWEQVIRADERDRIREGATA